MTTVCQRHAFSVAQLKTLKRRGALSLAMLVPVVSGAADSRGPGSDVQVLPEVVVPAGQAEEFCLSETFKQEPVRLYFTAMKRRPELEGTRVSRYTFPLKAQVQDHEAIVSINGRTVIKRERFEGMEILLSPVGTVVTLELLSAGEKKTRRLDLVVRSYTPQDSEHPARVVYALAPAAAARPAAK